MPPTNIDKEIHPLSHLLIMAMLERPVSIVSCVIIGEFGFLRLALSASLKDITKITRLTMITAVAGPANAQI